VRVFLSLDGIGGVLLGYTLSSSLEFVEYRIDHFVHKLFCWNSLKTPPEIKSRPKRQPGRIRCRKGVDFAWRQRVESEDTEVAFFCVICFQWWIRIVLSWCVAQESGPLSLTSWCIRSSRNHVWVTVADSLFHFAMLFGSQEHNRFRVRIVGYAQINHLEYDPMAPCVPSNCVYTPQERRQFQFFNM
jgi:hypothetical protein